MCAGRRAIFFLRRITPLPRLRKQIRRFMRGRASRWKNTGNALCKLSISRRVARHLLSMTAAMRRCWFIGGIRRKTIPRFSMSRLIIANWRLSMPCSSGNSSAIRVFGTIWPRIFRACQRRRQRVFIACIRCGMRVRFSFPRSMSMIR